MTTENELYFIRGLQRCEQRIADRFNEPLDPEQLRQITNIQQTIIEHKNLRADIGIKYQSRVDEMSRFIQPWIEKKDAILISLENTRSKDIGGGNDLPSGDGGMDKPRATESQDIMVDQIASEEPPNHNDHQALSESRIGTTGPRETGQMKGTERGSMPSVTSQAKEESTMPKKRQELLGEDEGLRRRGVVPDTVEGVERLLKSQRATQEDLTSDLVKMASVLKNNSKSFGELLEKDKTLLDETSEVLGSNLDKIGKQGSRLNSYRKRAWGTTGMSCILILVVVSVFFLLVLFMRVAPKRY